MCKHHISKTQVPVGLVSIGDGSPGKSDWKPLETSCFSDVFPNMYSSIYKLLHGRCIHTTRRHHKATTLLTTKQLKHISTCNRTFNSSAEKVCLWVLQGATQEGLYRSSRTGARLGYESQRLCMWILSSALRVTIKQHMCQRNTNPSQSLLCACGGCSDRR